jgi:hypothetical protein
VQRHIDWRVKPGNDERECRGTAAGSPHYREGPIRPERNFSMRAIMLALAATFIFSGTMAGITTVRAQDSTTVIKHDDGDKTVIKKYNDDDADKKVIIKKHDD